MSDLWTAGGAAVEESTPNELAEVVCPVCGRVQTGVLEHCDHGRGGTPAPPPGLPFLFMGEVFHMRPVVDYQWELLVWADIAENGEKVNAIKQNAATLRLIRSSLVDGEWARFAELASHKRAQTVRDLMPVVMTMHTRVTGLPTVPPSDSSDGRQATPGSSGGELSSRVIAREVANGRVDRALIVEMSAEAQAGRSGT